MPYAQPMYQYGPAATVLPNESLSVPAMVLSLVGLMCGVTAPVGAIMGFISLKRIKKSGGTLGGRGLAMTGAIVGSIISALMIIYIVVIIIAVVASSNGSNY